MAWIEIVDVLVLLESKRYIQFHILSELCTQMKKFSNIFSCRRLVVHSTVLDGKNIKYCHMLNITLWGASLIIYFTKCSLSLESGVVLCSLRIFLIKRGTVLEALLIRILHRRAARCAFKTDGFIFSRVIVIWCYGQIWSNEISRITNIFIWMRTKPLYSKHLRNEPLKWWNFKRIKWFTMFMPKSWI